MTPQLQPETPELPPWQETARSAAERVDLLLAEMTLEEKVGQLGSRWVGNDSAESAAVEPTIGEPEAGPDEPFNVAPMQDVFATADPVPLEDASRHGLGHVTRVYGSAPVTAAEGAKELIRQQRVVMESSRLHIPALVHEE